MKHFMLTDQQRAFIQSDSDDHVVSMEEMECILCDNEEVIDIPIDMSPRRERTLRMWMFSQFKDIDCVNRLA